MYSIYKLQVKLNALKQFKEMRYKMKTEQQIRGRISRLYKEMGQTGIFKDDYKQQIKALDWVLSEVEE
jgi:hypothetical protein